MNTPPDLTVIPGGKPADPAEPEQPDEQPAHRDLIELALPKTASDAFMFLSVRAAEYYATHTAEQQWAMISEVFKKLAEFASSFPYASARHVKWGYAVVFKRVPQARDEAGPIVKWLEKVPALATDKAAAAPLLWHYIASCAGQYAGSIPVPRGKPGAWEYMKGELTIPCSNEQAYMLGQQRHFWATYQGRLLYVVGLLLQEMVGVPVPQVGEAPVTRPPAAAQLAAVPEQEGEQPAPANDPAPQTDSPTDPPRSA